MEANLTRCPLCEWDVVKPCDPIGAPHCGLYMEFCAEKKASDNVYKPKHYTQYKIEPITFIMENQLPFAMGNVIKYVMRYKFKNGLEDLKKARRYIDMIIEQEYPDQKG